jgi:chemotaxis protein methyltransferase CheR
VNLRMREGDRANSDAASTERQQFESRLLLEALYWRSGTDLRGGAPQHVMMLVDALRKEMDLPTITAMTERVVHNDLDLQQVQDALRTRLGAATAISSVDAKTIDHWRNHVVPLLRSTPFPTVWVHDCRDIGVLSQLSAVLNESGLSKRSTVFVTCGDAAHVAPLRLQLQHALAISANAASANFIVAEYNIHTDGTFNEFDFILCGTVLRRLAAPVLRRVMRLFAESLTPCGVLQLLALDAADAARVAPIFLPMSDGAHLYRHALLERHAQRRHEFL